MINIIGAGMAGSILAKLLRKEQIEFNLFEAEKKFRSSIISENLIGTTWYDSMIRGKALEILSTIVPIRLIDSMPHSKLKAHHVYVSDLLEQTYMKGEADIIDGGVMFNGRFYKGMNIICTGVWANDFVKTVPMAGHGYVFNHKLTHVDEFIAGDWKPYRHIKLIEFDKGRTWFGNTVVVNNDKYWRNHEGYKKELREVAAKYLGAIEDLEPSVGYRPKTKEQSITFTGKHYVITGGYKSGMVVYPIMCQQMVNIIKRDNL